jgi:heme/copper-type cytochrome/quinol oxidase subunit 2
MSNTIKKEFSQDIEKELEDFNNNSPSEIGFSQAENRKIFGILDNREKKQRIDQQDYLFNWIISICNKFLIGVSLVFCMFMFEFKKDLIETENFFNLVYLVFLIIIWCLALFWKKIFELHKSIFEELEGYSKLKKGEESIEEKAEKATIKLIKIIFYTTAIAFFYLSINKIFIVREDIKEAQPIIIALITSTTSTVIGLPAIVAMAIFRSEKKKKKQKESDIFD